MNFEFQPWERLVEEIADGPPDGAGSLGLGGKWREFDFCVRAGRLFFRLNGQSGPEWNLLCFNEGARGNSLKEAEKCLKNARKAGMFGRWFRLGSGDFGDGGDAVLLLGANRAFYVPPPNQRVSDASHPFNSHRWDFDFEVPTENFWETPSSQLWPLVQNQWANPDSSLRFAARFCVLSEREKQLFRVRCERGTSEELERALVAFLHSLDFWKDATQIRLSLSPGLDKNRLRAGESVWSLDAHSRGQRIELSRVQIITLGRLTRFFGPHDGAASPDAPAPFQKWAQNRDFGLAVEASPPSAHERLEASFLMKEILREKLDEKKVRLLLKR